MTINATLLVQLLNFIVAYFIIKNLLLKPAIKILDGEDKKLNNLHNNLEKEQALLLKLEKEKQNYVIKTKKDFLAKHPSFNKRQILHFVNAPEAPKLSEENIYALSKEVSSLISKRIVDV